MQAPQLSGSALERAYVDIRRQVLSPAAADFEINRSIAAERYGVSLNSANQILSTLTAEGYLERRGKGRSRSSFVVATWSAERLAEIATIAAGIVSVALGQSSVMTDMSPLATVDAAAEAFAASNGEQTFFSMIAVFVKLFDAACAPQFKDVVSDIVPSSFLRLAWLSDSAGELPNLARTMIQRLLARDLPGAREANVFFWATAETGIAGYLAAAKQGLVDGGRVELACSRDLSLSGQLRPFDRALAAPLLPPLPDGSS